MFLVNGICNGDMNLYRLLHNIIWYSNLYLHVL